VYFGMADDMIGAARLTAAGDQVSVIE
jgi:hypothetical protein